MHLGPNALRPRPKAICQRFAHGHALGVQDEMVEIIQHKRHATGLMHDTNISIRKTMVIVFQDKTLAHVRGQRLIASDKAITRCDGIIIHAAHMQHDHRLGAQPHRCHQGRLRFKVGPRAAHVILVDGIQNDNAIWVERQSHVALPHETPQIG